MRRAFDLLRDEPSDPAHLSRSRRRQCKDAAVAAMMRVEVAT